MFALVMSLVGSASAGDPVKKLKMQSAYPPGDATYDVHTVETAKLIENASGGKIKIDLFTPGALCDVKEMVNAVSRGMLDIAAIYGPAYAGSVPVADFEGGLPFSWVSMDQVIELFWDSKYRVIDTIRAGWDKKNIHYLVPNACGSYPFNLNFPLEKISDFKGHKIRAMGSAGKWLQLAGASPVPLPGAEIYMALKLGTVDGTPFPPMGLETLKFKEVVKYMVFPGLVTPPQTCIIINKDVWKSLPEEARKTLGNEKTLKDHYVKCGNAYKARDDAALETAYKYGLKGSTMADDQLKEGRKLAVQVWDEVAEKDPFAKKAIETLKRFLTDKGQL